MALACDGAVGVMTEFLVCLWCWNWEVGGAACVVVRFLVM